MRLLIFQSVDVAASADFSYHQRMINVTLYISIGFLFLIVRQ